MLKQGNAVVRTGVPMRTFLALVAALALTFAFVAIAPTGHAAGVTACTDLVHEGCEGYYCLDRNGDRKYQWNECEPRYCTCDPQPTPW